MQGYDPGRTTDDWINRAKRAEAQRDRLLEALEGLLCGAEFTLTNPRKPNDGPVIPAEMTKDEFECKRVVIAARAALASVKESQ